MPGPDGVRRERIVPGRREEIIFGIFRVEAAFDGVAGKRDVVLREGKRLARGDANLQLYQIEAGDHFRDGMLHLKARIHFEKIEIARGIHQKLDRPRVRVARFARQFHGGFAHGAAQFGRHDRGRRFLDDFLVPALDRAFALAEIHDVAVRVAEYLNFDVARPLEIPFEIDAAHRRTR